MTDIPPKKSEDLYRKLLLERLSKTKTVHSYTEAKSAAKVLEDLLRETSIVSKSNIGVRLNNDETDYEIVLMLDENDLLEEIPDLIEGLKIEMINVGKVSSGLNQHPESKNTKITKIKPVEKDK